MKQEKIGLQITNKWTGKRYLYPTIYNTTEDAAKAKNTIPQNTKNNEIEVVKILIYGR